MEKEKEKRDSESVTEFIENNAVDLQTMLRRKITEEESNQKSKEALQLFLKDNTVD